MSSERQRISRTNYRWLDIGTKLIGLALIVAGLESGITSALGLTLSVLGVLIGVSTVFITEETQ